MKKLTPELEKGMEAERRLLRLARSLKGEHRWLGHVRKAGSKHDRAGVDVIVYAYSLTGEAKKVLPIAFQVKSSATGVRQFYAKNADAARIGVTPIVVNDMRSDETILHDIARAISRGIFSKGRAERVSAYLSQVRRGLYSNPDNAT